MNGLIVLIPYTTGQDFYEEWENDMLSGEFVYDPEDGQWLAEFREPEMVNNGDDFEDSDLETKIQGAINPQTGEFQHAVFSYNPEEGEWSFIESDWEPPTLYLPVFVETLHEDLALMAAAYAACVDYKYVAFPSSSKTSQEWENQGYPGTLEHPEVELPIAEEAFEIPEPGDCFCCASLEDYLVITIEEMLEKVQNSPYEFISSKAIPSEEDRRELWIQFNEWSIRSLNDSIFDEE